ncbi:MAG: CBS domain-containing protein [Magnetococcales bacterium]|nr:CBS domain-containing protein [Magnetococcales bacterium]
MKSSASRRSFAVAPVTAGMSRFLGILETADDMLARPSARDILPDWTIGQLRSRQLPDADVEQFADLIHRARTQVDCDSALEFLGTLTRRELHLLAKVHGLSRPIQGETLTEEQAMQLLNPFAVAPGQLPAMVFPPPHAPHAVHRAWAEATAGQNSLELLDSMAPFLAQSAACNTRYDAQETPIGCIAPTEPDYFDLYAERSFSYPDQVVFLTDALNSCRACLEPATFRKRKGFLLHYRLALGHGVH